MSSDLILSLHEIARAVVARYQPGHAAARVVILTEDGEEAFATRIPLNGHTANGHAGPKLSEADRTILEAVAGLGESPTGQEIARAAGYPYDSHVKMRLSLLRRRKLLGGERGETGYPLTDLAAELLAAE